MVSFSRNIGSVTPKMHYFHCLRISILDKNFQNIFHSFSKTEALMMYWGSEELRVGGQCFYFSRNASEAAPNYFLYKKKCSYEWSFVSSFHLLLKTNRRWSRFQRYLKSEDPDWKDSPATNLNSNREEFYLFGNSAICFLWWITYFWETFDPGNVLLDDQKKWWSRWHNRWVSKTNSQTGNSAFFFKIN